MRRQRQNQLRSCARPARLHQLPVQFRSRHREMLQKRAVHFRQALALIQILKSDPKCKLKWFGGLIGVRRHDVQRCHTGSSMLPKNAHGPRHQALTRGQNFRAVEPFYPRPAIAPPDPIQDTPAGIPLIPPQPLPSDAIMNHMSKATLRDLRYRFSQVESLLQQGEEVQITRRKRIIARLLPPQPAARAARPDFLARLKRIYGNKVLTVSGAQLLAQERDR